MSARGEDGHLMEGRIIKIVNKQDKIIFFDYFHNTSFFLDFLCVNVQMRS